MEFFSKDQILSITYTNKSQLYPILDICDKYENGNFTTRIGFNFPMSFVEKEYPTHFLCKKYKSIVRYVIVYKKGDIQTKKHELQHAKYYLDKEFRISITNIWNNISDTSKHNIIHFLKKNNYPRKVWLDEFQAYYFTEKPNFFGKLEFSL